MSRKAGKELRQQLARDIWEAGSKDPETIAAYLIKKGWRKERKTITIVNSGVVQNAIMTSLRNPQVRDREQY